MTLLCKNSLSSRTRRMSFSDRSKSTALRYCRCSICDLKRDLFYQFSTPSSFYTPKTQSRHAPPPVKRHQEPIAEFRLLTHASAHSGWLMHGYGRPGTLTLV